MAHDKIHFDPNKEYYRFGGGLKTMSIVFIVLGIIGAVWAYFDNHGANQHSRFWSNLLLNTYYFNGIAIAAVFFVAAHTIGYGGWFVVVKRIFESFGYFVFVTAVFFLLIVLGIWFDWHNLYDHWLNAPKEDTIVGDKKAFLNPTMFTFLTLTFSALWIIGVTWMRKQSLADEITTNKVAYNQKSKYISAFYIVIFGVSSSIFSWVAIMSLDPHWYSTLFGWYNFASYMCGFLAMAILVITYLKYKGLLVNVNENHMHNLALFLFGFSVFYTYLWFSQFMLIWYGNIPEDTMYFYKRFNVPLFKVLFFVTFIINFIFPFLFILKRNAKRNIWITGIASAILLFGHYLDFYLMVMPEPNAPMHHTTESNSHHSNIPTSELKLLANNEIKSDSAVLNETVTAVQHTDEHTSNVVATIHNETHEAHAATTDAHAKENTHEAHHEENIASLGLIEIFMFLGFIGLFLFTTLSVLSKNRIVPTNNPFLEESLRHQY